MFNVGQVADRTDADAEPDIRVQCDPLRLGVDALKGELADDPIGVGLIAVRTGLQHVGSRLLDLDGGQVALHLRSFSGTTTSKFGSME